MKQVILDLYDDCVDKIVAASLKETLRIMADETCHDLFPDHAEITAACKVLLDYHSVPSEVEQP